MAYISRIKLPNEAESREIKDTEARNIANSKAADAVFVPSGPGAMRGLVPAPPTTAGTAKYLREDGTWVEPEGGIASVDEAQNSHLNITTSNSEVTVNVASGYVIPPDTVQASASGGSTLTLVSTGDKYTWDHKQDAITVGSELNADLVDDSTSTNKFVTETDISNWNDKQDKITSTDKLDADLVDDTTATNKFVTAADKTSWDNKLDGITVNNGTADVKVTQTKLVAGSNKVTLTPDATNHTITIDSTGTTYTAGTGIDITNADVINNTGVTSVTASDASTGTNGTISVSTAGATAVEVAVKGLNNAAYKDVDTSITTSTQSANLPTSAAVDAYVQNAIAGITGPMIFKGAVTINADRSITVPSTVTSIKQGYTFKITELNVSYTGTLKVGDTLIADKDNPLVTSAWVENTDWTVIPSGDEEAATYPKFEFITDYVYTRVTTATTWAADTYYSRSGDTYTLTTSEPADWDTNYYSYYTKSSATGSFIGIAYSAS